MLPDPNGTVKVYVVAPAELALVFLATYMSQGSSPSPNNGVMVIFRELVYVRFVEWAGVETK
jgi:hypothetical protein